MSTVLSSISTAVSLCLCTLLRERQVRLISIMEEKFFGKVESCLKEIIEIIEEAITMMIKSILIDTMMVILSFLCGSCFLTGVFL